MAVDMEFTNRLTLFVSSLTIGTLEKGDAGISSSPKPLPFPCFPLSSISETQVTGALIAEQPFQQLNV
jgi:hypothetical protein